MKRIYHWRTHTSPTLMCRICKLRFLEVLVCVVEMGGDTEDEYVCTKCAEGIAHFMLD